MKIPTDKLGLLTFAKELRDECRVSVDRRRDQARVYRQLYYTGTLSSRASKHNKCYSLLDKLQSFLFSPSELRVSIDIEGDEQDAFGSICEAASRHMNQELARVWGGTTCSLNFGTGVGMGLVDGCAFIKPVWRWTNKEKTRGYFKSHLVRQSFMGVLREDVSDLDEQEAFTHSQYFTRAGFSRLLLNHPKRDELIRAAQAAYRPADDDVLQDTYLREIVSGGLNPISLTGTPSGAMGNVQVFAAPPAPMLSPELMEDLIRVDDLWVFDDNQGDWVTIRMCEPDVIIEGDLRLQNLGDVPGRQPFTKICPNEVDGYFWGRSELAGIAALQEILNQRINDVDDIFRQQAKPPRAFSGFGAITSEKAMALLAAGGTLTEDAPVGAKVENLAPQMPAMAMEYLDAISNWMDDAAGFTAVMSGDGDPSVRAGAQANTLMRVASPRMRDRSLIVEAQCAEFADKALAMSQAKNARVFKTTDETAKQFTLKQLPSSARVVVDSHSSSPAFQGDYLNIAFAMQKAGMIDEEDALSLIHPPREDHLIEKAKERKAAQAKFMAEHPELALDGAKKGKSR